MPGGRRGRPHRLVDWARRVSPTTGVDDQVVDLSAITLSWLFAPSNRFLRDTATKALVSLLDGRLESTRRLVERFADIDDPYVVERVYAVAYGVSLRARDADGVGRVAHSVYNHVFAQGNPPAHILVRDYARGVIERAAHLGAEFHVDMEKVRPSYRSTWPVIPGDEDIQKLIHKMDQVGEGSDITGAGWHAMRSSVMAWDFARYVIGTNSSGRSRDWLSLGIEEEKWRPVRERREELMSEFNPEELAALDAYKGLGPQLMAALRAAAKSAEANDDCLLGVSAFGEQREEAYQHFLSALSDEHRAAWELLEEGRPGYSLEEIQRYILNRVVELGWTSARFGWFDGYLDRAVSHGRSERKAERIGKKYQWIAYHEILAYLADHFQFCQEWGSGVSRYEGPWQIGRRDIDPSAPLDLPSRRVGESSGTGSAWWAPTTYNDWCPDLPTDAWVSDTDDIPELDSGLVVQDPENPGASWICCFSFQLFQEPQPPDQDRSDVDRREVWLRRMAFLVPKGSSDRFIEWTMSGGFRGVQWQMSVPRLDSSGVFVGEHCWSVASAQQVEEQDAEPLEWTYPPDANPFPALNPVVSHSTSVNGYDCSVEPGEVELCLPSHTVMEGCQLSWTGLGVDHVDRDSQLAAFDPSAHEHGPCALLIRSDVLEEYLFDRGLELCWVIGGEKQAIGSFGQPYGRLELQGAFAYRDGAPDGRSGAEYRGRAVPEGNE